MSGIGIGLMARAKAEIGQNPGPAQIVAWAAGEADHAKARMVASGRAIRPDYLGRCSACAGLGYVPTPDGRGAWCTAPDCRLGFVKVADVQAKGCAVCNGSEWVSERVGEHSVRAVPCVCMGHDRVASVRLQAAGVPVKYRGLTIEGWQKIHRDQQGLLADAVSLAGGLMTEDRRPGLFLHGPPGRGKSGLAAGIAGRYVVRDPSAIWISWATWTDQLNDLRSAGASPTEVIRRASRASLLIIDDLGAEGNVTDWRQRVLLDLIEHRAAGVTVITSMLGIDEVDERYGEHITSRIIELCRPVALLGENLRVRGEA